MNSTNNNIHDTLSYLKTLGPIPLVEEERIISLFKPLNIEKNEYFIRAGEAPVNVAFVTNGLFRYFYVDSEGREYTKYFAMRNDLLISYTSALLGEESRFYIQALDDSSVFISTFKAFYEMIEGHPCWDRIARKLIEIQYVKKEQREYQFLFEDAETRYTLFLEEYPGLIEKVKHYHIASYLGISPVSLSRVRKNLIS